VGQLGQLFKPLHCSTREVSQRQAAEKEYWSAIMH